MERPPKLQRQLVDESPSSGGMADDPAALARELTLAMTRGEGTSIEERGRAAEVTATDEANMRAEIDRIAADIARGMGEEFRRKMAAETEDDDAPAPKKSRDGRANAKASPKNAKGAPVKTSAKPPKTVWPPASSPENYLAARRLAKKGVPEDAIAGAVPAERRRRAAKAEEPAAPALDPDAVLAAEMDAMEKRFAAGVAEMTSPTKTSPEKKRGSALKAAETLLTEEEVASVRRALEAETFPALLDAYRNMASVSGQDPKPFVSHIRKNFSEGDLPAIKDFIRKALRERGVEIETPTATEPAAPSPVVTPTTPEASAISPEDRAGIERALSATIPAELYNVRAMMLASGGQATKFVSEVREEVSRNGLEAGKQKIIDALAARGIELEIGHEPALAESVPDLPPPPLPPAPKFTWPEPEADEVSGREGASIQRRRDRIAAELKAARAEDADAERDVRHLTELIEMAKPPRLRAALEKKLDEARGEQEKLRETRASRRGEGMARAAKAPKTSDAETIRGAVIASADPFAPRVSGDVAELLAEAGNAAGGSFEKFYEVLHAHAPEIVGSVQDYRAEDIIEIVEAIRRGEPGIGIEHLTRTFGIREAAMRLIESERRTKMLAEARALAAAAESASFAPPAVEAPRPKSGGTGILTLEDLGVPSTEELAERFRSAESFGEIASLLNNLSWHLTRGARGDEARRAAIEAAAAASANGESLEWLDPDEFPKTAGLRDALARLKSRAETERLGLAQEAPAPVRPIEDLRFEAEVSASFEDLLNTSDGFSRYLSEEAAERSRQNLERAATAYARGESLEWLDPEDFPETGHLRETVARLKDDAEQLRRRRGPIARGALKFGLKADEALERASRSGFVRALGLGKLFRNVGDWLYRKAWAWSGGRVS